MPQLQTCQVDERAHVYNHDSTRLCSRYRWRNSVNKVYWSSRRTEEDDGREKRVRRACDYFFFAAVCIAHFSHANRSIPHANVHLLSLIFILCWWDGETWMLKTNWVRMKIEDNLKSRRIFPNFSVSSTFWDEWLAGRWRRSTHHTRAREKGWLCQHTELTESCKKFCNLSQLKQIRSVNRDT